MLPLHISKYQALNMDCDIKSMTGEAVELLCRLIDTPRTSRDERQAADLLQAHMEGRGLRTQRKGNNIWCAAEGNQESRPTLLLNAHIDTVKPVSAWQRNPFKHSQEGDRLYGLGSNDDGASLVSLLEVFMQLQKTEQSYNLIYLASCEEEVSGRGGIESVIPDLPHIDFALVGEPTGMQPAVAEKGLMVLDVEAHGKSGHAARNEGVNAIYKAMPDIEWFRTFRFPKQSDLLGPVKMSVTMVNAGTQHNVVPDLCTFVVDVRSNECYSNHELFDEICRHITSTAKARSFRLNSSMTPPDNPVLARAVALGRKPFGSPTLSDQALMPFPSMKMGPGESSRSHTADEFVCISEIEEAIGMYLRMLDGVSMSSRKM